MKECTKCGVLKPLSAFPKDYRKIGKLEARCQSCKTANSRAWRAANAAHVRSYGKEQYAKSPIKWARHILKKYGVDAQEYEQMFRNQKGVCAICRVASPARLNIDHDHRTGKVRGLLCGECNRMLGQSRDDPAVLRSAANYLDAALT